MIGAQQLRAEALRCRAPAAEIHIFWSLRRRAPFLDFFRDEPEHILLMRTHTGIKPLLLLGTIGGGKHVWRGDEHYNPFGKRMVRGGPRAPSAALVAAGCKMLMVILLILSLCTCHAHKW